jgi:hypothetical protein
MHKFIRGVFGVITIFVIAAPLPGLIQNGFNFDFDWGDSVNIDQGYLDAIKQQQLRILEKGTEKMLKKKGVSGIKLTIKGNIEKMVVEIERVEINMSKVVITPDNPNINKNELVIGLVMEGLKIERNIIFIVDG